MATRAYIAFLACGLFLMDAAFGDVPYQATPRSDENSRIAHQQLLEKKTRGEIDIYFLGDSITRRWGATDERYRPLLENWRKNFYGWNAANFGWGADGTQHMLWRLENGELDGVNPKIIVLMAGTNNVGKESPVADDTRVADITRGIRTIVELCRQKAPKATIIITGITPRNDNIAVMPIIDGINANLAKLADGRSIRYLDLNRQLADKNGKLFEGMTDPDQLHLALKAYQIWADALKPIFTELLGPPAKVDHAPPPTGDPSATAATARVTALADQYVAEFAKTFPEQAEFSGMTLEHHDGMTDNSLPGLKRWETLEDGWSTELAKIDSAPLFGKPEWVVLGFLREAVESSRQLRVCRQELWPVNQMSGWPFMTTQLAAIQPVGSEQARREALARWSKLPKYLSNELDNLREGLRGGYSTPQANVRLFIAQLDEMLAQPVEEWPMYSPASRDDSPEFKQAWAALLSREIKPAAERYAQYLKNEYLGKARESIAITANPNGEKCYRASFRSYTTLDRPAKETFELGRREVERNLSAALAIGKKDLQANDLPALLERLQQDPANHFTSRDQLLKFAQAAVGRAKDHMPKWFARVPEAKIIVEPYPDFLEKTASDSYWPAAQDGSRPAMYRITLYPYAQTTRSNAEITAFHEAYPGHHLQIALAAERPTAHPITRLVGNSGFAEGWARYAEALAEEMGLYSSNYALANRRLWPARGMVVDPGIHMFGWTREQTIKFVAESGRFDTETARSLVDRVAMWPGQLTAYDTGALEFFALRKQAQETLGTRFDIREFHSVLLENGTVTLPMLREQVTHWLKSKTGK